MNADDFGRFAESLRDYHASQIAAEAERRLYVSEEGGEAMNEYIVTQDWIKGDEVGKPIVRCKDCRFYEEAGFCNWFECSYCNECQRVEPYGFCAWGERRGDAE